MQEENRSGRDHERARLSYRRDVEADRTAGGNRQYDHNQLKRLSFVKRSRELGFSLEEIRALLEMVDRSDFTCGEVYALTTGHLVSVRERIATLRKLEKALADMAAECSKGDVPHCPIVDMLFDAH